MHAGACLVSVSQEACFQARIPSQAFLIVCLLAPISRDLLPTEYNLIEDFHYRVTHALGRIVADADNGLYFYSPQNEMI